MHLKGKERTYNIVEHPGGAGVLAVHNGQVLLVEQFRPAVGKKVLEIPAGTIDPSEAPLETAKRELAEETGFTARKWSSLGAVYPTPGYSSEITYLFLAEDLTPGTQHLDDGEDIAVRHMDLSELLHLIASEEVLDAKTVIAVLRYTTKEKEGYDAQC